MDGDSPHALRERSYEYRERSYEYRERRYDAARSCGRVDRGGELENGWRFAPWPSRGERVGL